jgi:mono/diheme cytochrome c family protein
MRLPTLTPRPLRAALLPLLVGGVALGSLIIGTGAAASASSAAKPTVITVYAGVPSPLSFTLSRSSDLRPGIFRFKVESMGHIVHDFKVCKTPVTNVADNSCAGVATKKLDPGQSATLIVTITAKGRYEYLSSLPQQAADGMKGLIGVGVSLFSATPAPAPTTTTKSVGHTCAGRCTQTAEPTTYAKPPATESLTGDPSVGMPLFVSQCGSCHALTAAGTTSTTGPDLDQVSPTQEELIAYITYGSDSMPAFGGSLNGDQIRAVAAYVYASTHTSSP